MPTARELLEQADALMRRNRTTEQEADIPELTDEIAVAGTGTPSRVMLSSRPAPRQRHSRDDDVPELNDAVEELSIHPLPDDEGEVSRWLEADLGEASITGPAPDSIAVVPPSTLRAAPSQTSAAAATGSQAPIASTAATTVAPTATAALAARVAGTLVGPPAEPPPASDPGFEAMLGKAPAETAFEQELTPSPAAPSPAAPTPVSEEASAPVAKVDAVAAPDEHQWEGLAEEIRMQVLQRIDIFTDTGLKEQLNRSSTARAPISWRPSTGKSARSSVRTSPKRSSARSRRGAKVIHDRTRDCRRADCARGGLSIDCLPCRAFGPVFRLP
jgi:hypothetical protein